ncbi:nucleoside deaminase [Streptomyces sp. Root1310]|uniref:nucleoside deaminase n=1 Tax=Streptomyces sp. Root1310 TaxID=1736452 RepID=UPI000AAF225E
MERAAETPRVGEEPFGSGPMGGDGTAFAEDHDRVAFAEDHDRVAFAEDHNRVAFAQDHDRVAFAEGPRPGGLRRDRTRHPEVEPGRRSARPTAAGCARRRAGTAGAHCPMGAVAHAWVRLGRIVNIASSEQLTTWLGRWGAPAPPVRTDPAGARGHPRRHGGRAVPGLVEEVHARHRPFRGG